MEATTWDNRFMLEAIALGRQGMEANAGGPFGCVIVRDGAIVGRGHNEVTTALDPTAHAEVVAIRDACRTLGSFQLTGCTLYTSCEPCPMCLGAIYWARPDRVYYACTRQDAAAVGFDDDFIYREIHLSPDTRSIPMHMRERDAAMALFRDWEQKPDKIRY